VLHHGQVSRWLGRRRSLSRWLGRRSLWQFVVWWAWATVGGLLGIAAVVGLGGHVHLGAWVAALAFGPIGATTGAVWRRQRREDANTVDEWISSRRPPPLWTGERACCVSAALPLLEWRFQQAGTPGLRRLILNDLHSSANRLVSALLHVPSVLCVRPAHTTRPAPSSIQRCQATSAYSHASWRRFLQRAYLTSNAACSHAGYPGCSWTSAGARHGR